VNDKKTAVIFDWQGTLVDVSSARHLVEGPGKKDFTAFHRASAACPPIPSTMAAAWQARADGHSVLVFTGCSDDHEVEVWEWHHEYAVPFSALHMRVFGDWRRDVEIKREMLADARTRYEIVHAWDDNPNVIAEVWESEGVPVTVVPGWTGG
jgi:FMN phosphatase YigB (HAD superfamily)